MKVSAVLDSTAARLRHAECGFTLVELLTVLVMLVIVVTTLSSVLVTASKAEEEMSRRFGSQINARIALDQLRREIHCAVSVTPTGTSTAIAIVLGSRCPTGSGTASWCTSGSGTRYALYRKAGSTCDTAGRRVVDYLTSGTVFSFTPQSTSSLAYLSVTLSVNTKPATGLPDYRLQDDVVLRNSTRT